MICLLDSGALFDIAGNGHWLLGTTSSGTVSSDTYPLNPLKTASAERAAFGTRRLSFVLCLGFVAS